MGNASFGTGTSAATPVVAALIALLNDYRLSVGLPTLGFLNPVLYKRGVAGFNDITQGGNIGCGTEGFNVSAVRFCFLLATLMLTSLSFQGNERVGSRWVFQRISFDLSR